jgi:hypothetical protein
MASFGFDVSACRAAANAAAMTVVTRKGAIRIF